MKLQCLGFVSVGDNAFAEDESGAGGEADEQASDERTATTDIPAALQDKYEFRSKTRKQQNEG